MNCQRCNGLTVSDDSFAVQTGSPTDYHGWRCINCGMLVDDVISRNRCEPMQQRVDRARLPRRYSGAAA